MEDNPDWDKLYYGIVKHTNNENVELMSVGSTKMIVKQACFDRLIALKGKVSPEIERAVMNCDLFRKAYFHSYYDSCLEIVYCEAKIKIYAERYGIDGMVICPDPCYHEDLYRFVKYNNIVKNSRKNSIKKNKEKFNA